MEAALHVGLASGSRGDVGHASQLGRSTGRRSSLRAGRRHPPRAARESAGLRAYDATHCAAAIAINDDHLVAATGARRLLAAWHAEGLATWNPNG